VPADRCDVDHLAEWERDDGGTDQTNATPRCSTHNPWKTANRIRSTRNHHGDIIDVRPDGTPITPIGRRHHPEPDDEPDPTTHWKQRTIRVDYCRLHHHSTRRQLAELLAS
jgi:hypothetical protein